MLPTHAQRSCHYVKPQRVQAAWHASPADPEKYASSGIAPLARLARVRGQNILFSASRRTLFTLNDTAADIWQALEQDIPVGAILDAMVAGGVEGPQAEAYFEAALRDWERFGLISLNRSLCPAATQDCLSQVVAVAGLRARILYPRADTSHVANVFRHLQLDTEAVDVVLQLVERGKRIDLFRDGVWAACCGPEEIPIMVKGQLLAEALERCSYGLALHVAAVLHRDRALLLCGSQGAGKTTLALALLRAGFDFMADDVTLLDSAGHGIGLAFAPAVKAGSWPVLSGYFPTLGISPVYRRPDGRRVRFLVPEDHVPATPQRIGWVVLLRRGRIVEPALRAIEPAEMLNGLLNGAFAQEAELSNTTFDVLCDVIRSAQGFCLTYSRLDDAVDLLKVACR